MKKIKITKEQVKGFVRNCCLLAYGAAAIAGACMVKRPETSRITNYARIATYSEAVKVIMESSMFSSSKTRAIELLKRDQDSDYYAAVIAIVNSNMFASNKIEAIETISKMK